jgi:hypothetical protein
VDLLIARNPDPDSSLPYLLRVPLGEHGLVFRAKDTWPRTNAIYCHPVPAAEWPAEPQIVESVPLKACTRRGAAIDVVADRSRENRSQIVFTRSRGRETVFWQSPRTRKQARPDVRVPTARAAGLADLEIIVDAHERYPYKFSGQQVSTTRRALPAGDYAVASGGEVVAAVERKSLGDLASSVTSGRLLAVGPDRVLRDAGTRRGVDLPLSRGGPDLGRRGGRRQVPHGAAREGPGAVDGRGPGLGAGQGHGGASEGPAQARGARGVASRPSRLENVLISVSPDFPRT